MNYIIIKIKDTDTVKIIFEDDFIDQNQFVTQNRLIEDLKLLFVNFTVELFYKEITQATKKEAMNK